MSQNTFADSPPGPADAERLRRESVRLETELFDPRHMARAERVGQAAAALGLVDLELRARLVQADILLRSGETAAGGRTARDVNRWADANRHQYLLARSHVVLSRFFRYLGDRQRSLEDAVRAVELTPDDTHPVVRFDHELTLAVALSMTGSYAAARRRYERAEQLAEAHGTLRHRLSVLNNLAYCEYEAGNAAASLAVARRMQTLAEAHDVTLPASFIDTLGEAYLASGEYEAARAALLRVAAPGAQVVTTEADAVAGCLLTLAEVYRRLDDTAAAEETLDQCLALADEGGLAEIRASALLARAHLHADQGRYREAFEQHLVFHREWAELHRAESDARARITQAVFDAAEARQDSDRFRELSFRDPLTGLYNRRHVEERLPALLAEATETGGIVAVAIVDLDHFKQINDQCSHETGDLVLKAVAGYLGTVPAEGGFAARLGGEEFVLVLPGDDSAQAVRRCEEVRRLMRAHDWAPLTGQLPVTASFGAAVSTPEITESTELLRAADRNLYAAKRGGRDRVVTTAA